jgi:hypothetical protein
MNVPMFVLAKRGLLTVAMVTAAIMALPDAAEAQRRARPETKWCMRGPTGGQSCVFHTLDQCRKAAHGTGGSCLRNPRYGR